MTEPFDPFAELLKHGIQQTPVELPSEEIFGDGSGEALPPIEANVDDEGHLIVAPAPPGEVNVFEELAKPQPAGTAAGVKLDTGKLPIWKGVITYFGPALKAVAAISEFGSRKYTWGGWRTVEDGETRYTEALYRHTFAEAEGEDYDEETGMLHAAHAAWNALARLVLILQRTPLRKPD